MSGFFYLATPYSKYPGGIEEAFWEACKQTAVLIKAGIPVFSPIAHTHPIAIVSGLDPLDHSIWMPADRPMMEAAKGLIICKMDGWKESKGIREEADYFRDAGKLIIHMEPGKVPDLNCVPVLLNRRTVGICYSVMQPDGTTATLEIFDDTAIKRLPL